MTFRTLRYCREAPTHPLNIHQVRGYDEDIVILPFRKNLLRQACCMVYVKDQAIADAVIARHEHSSETDAPDEKQKIFLFKWDVTTTRGFLAAVASSIQMEVA